ncbi:hypothetical protein OUZ56_003275 [Daphnia magna]|uniref:Uncharacterized protein n=1 Tax=Daphnia magna TaxID=35525 RepID=A0ABR0A8F7_9CRUS|nr:hypothetical protein OUZ56_003275 [Daphnia magna]
MHVIAMLSYRFPATAIAAFTYSPSRSRSRIKKPISDFDHAEFLSPTLNQRWGVKNDFMCGFCGEEGDLEISIFLVINPFALTETARFKMTIALRASGVKCANERVIIVRDSAMMIDVRRSVKIVFIKGPDSKNPMLGALVTLMRAKSDPNSEVLRFEPKNWNGVSVFLAVPEWRVAHLPRATRFDNLLSNPTVASRPVSRVSKVIPQVQHVPAPTPEVSSGVVDADKKKRNRLKLPLLLNTYSTSVEHLQRSSHTIP